MADHGEAAGDGLEVLALAGAVDVVGQGREERRAAGRDLHVIPFPRQPPPRHGGAASRGAVRPERAEAGLQHDLPRAAVPLPPRLLLRPLQRRRLAHDRSHRRRRRRHESFCVRGLDLDWMPPETLID